jgi:hypothetical protein
VAKLVLTAIGSRYGSIDALNANFQAIEDAFENTLSLDGTIPNALEDNLDAGSFRIINLAAPVDGSDAVTKAYLDDITSSIEDYLVVIAIVADNITDVVSVADNIDTITDNAANIALVAGIVDEVEAVAQNLGSVELVGLDLNGAFESGVIYDFGSITEAPIGEAPVATSNIVLVANDIADVTTVAGAIGSVTTVASNISSVSTVATNITNVNTTAINIANVNLVGGSIADVNAVADNLAEILAADDEATAAAASAAAALVSEGNAATSETNAAASALSASGSATTASDAKDDAITAQLAAEAALASTLAAYDSFDDRYLGPKTNDPSLDNDGNALLAGSLYYNTTVPEMRVYTGTTWVSAYVPGSTFLAKANNLSDLTNTSTARTNLGVTATGSDTTYAYRANNLSDLASASTARTNLGLGTAATTASTDYATAAQGSKADTAYGWGNHALAGYQLTSGLGSLAFLSTVGTTEITNNAVTVGKLAATLDYGSIV